MQRHVLITGAVCGSSVCRLYFLGNAVPHTGEKTSSFSPLTPLSGLSRATPMLLGLSRRIIAPAFTGRLPEAVFPFTRGLLLALRSSSQLLLLGFCS